MRVRGRPRPQDQSRSAANLDPDAAAAGSASLDSSRHPAPPPPPSFRAVSPTSILRLQREHESKRRDREYLSKHGSDFAFMLDDAFT